MAWKRSQRKPRGDGVEEGLEVLKGNIVPKSGAENLRSVGERSGADDWRRVVQRIGAEWC